MGRTGVRGRGALIRWGPNKSIMAIITRWKKHRGQFAIVDGQRLLEAMIFKDRTSNDWKLPGVRDCLCIHSLDVNSFHLRERYWVLNRHTVLSVEALINLLFRMKTRNIVYLYKKKT